MKWLLCVLLCIILLGCGSSSVDKKIPSYRLGTQGLALELLPQFPPKEIPDGSSFRIAVKVKNAGAFDTGTSELEILGLNDAWVPLEHSDVKMISLKGRSIDVPDGDFSVYEFNGQNAALPPSVSEYRSKFWVVARYDYQTVAQTDVCINADLVGVQKTLSACTFKPSQSLGTQGAPVSISRVDQTIIPTTEGVSLEFTITIDNVGGGEIVSPVLIDEIKLANKRLTCSTTSLKAEDIKRRKNKIVCRTTEPNRGTYSTPFSATIHYTYSTKIPGEFTIRRLPSR